MKLNPMILMALVVSVALVGCGTAEEEAAAPTEEQTSETSTDTTETGATDTAETADDSTTDDDATDTTDDTVDDNADDSADSEDTFACTEVNTVCVSLGLPDTYTGDARQLFVGLYERLPPMGPPSVMLTPIDKPDVIAGGTYDAMFDVDADGDYFAYIVLYDEEGGQWMPEPGTDYLVETDEAVTFDGSPVNLGKLDLVLAN